MRRPRLPTTRDTCVVLFMIMRLVMTDSSRLSSSPLIVPQRLFSCGPASALLIMLVLSTSFWARKKWEVGENDLGVARVLSCIREKLVFYLLLKHISHVWFLLFLVCAHFLCFFVFHSYFCVHALYHPSQNAAGYAVLITPPILRRWSNYSAKIIFRSEFNRYACPHPRRTLMLPSPPLSSCSSGVCCRRRRESSGGAEKAVVLGCSSGIIPLSPVLFYLLLNQTSFSLYASSLKPISCFVLVCFVRFSFR